MLNALLLLILYLFILVSGTITLLFLCGIKIASIFFGVLLLIGIVINIIQNR